MSVLEIAHVEKPVLNWCKKNGIKHRKMNGMGNRSWPDRQFFLGAGRVFFIEFKAPGKRLEHLQYETIKDLLERGYDVEVHDDKYEAIGAIDGRLLGGKVASAQIPERFYPVAPGARSGRAVRRSRNG